MDIDEFYPASESNDIWILKDTERQLVTVEENGNSGVLSVKTSNMQKVSEVRAYAMYINSEITDIYLRMADEQIQIKQSAKPPINLSNLDKFFTALLSRKTFSQKISKGDEILTFEYPKKPTRVSPTLPNVLAWESLFGLVSGVLLVVACCYARLFSVQGSHLQS